MVNTHIWYSRRKHSAQELGRHWCAVTCDDNGHNFPSIISRSFFCTRVSAINPHVWHFAARSSILQDTCTWFCMIPRKHIYFLVLFHYRTQLTWAFTPSDPSTAWTPLYAGSLWHASSQVIVPSTKSATTEITSSILPIRWSVVSRSLFNVSG